MKQEKRSLCKGDISTTHSKYPILLNINYKSPYLNLSSENLIICPKNRMFELNKSDYGKSDYSGHTRS